MSVDELGTQVSLSDGDIDFMNLFAPLYDDGPGSNEGDTAFSEKALYIP